MTVSTDLVPLAVLMWAVTYPSRAIGLLAPAIDRLPRRVLDYLLRGRHEQGLRFTASPAA